MIDFDAAEEFNETGITLTPVLSGEVFKRLIAYPVVVEMWDKRKAGRVKRAWLKEFDESEREKAGRWYKKFYDWYLIKGQPQKVLIRPATIKFLQRLVNFFGSV